MCIGIIRNNSLVDGHARLPMAAVCADHSATWAGVWAWSRPCKCLGLYREVKEFLFALSKEINAFLNSVYMIIIFY